MGGRVSIPASPRPFDSKRVSSRLTSSRRNTPREPNDNSSTVEYFERLIRSIPNSVMDKLNHVNSFDLDEFSRGVVRPLRTLAFMCLKSAAGNVSGTSFVKLPVLLNKVAQRVNDVPGGLHLYKLQHMQFIYTQTRPGGALHQLSHSNPLHVVAACLAALFSDVPGLDYGSEMCAVVTSNMQPRRTGSQCSAIVNKAVNSWPSIKRFLTTTLYFNALGSHEQETLLEMLHHLIDVVANRGQMAEILRVCSTEPDSLKAHLHLLHGVLFLARYSSPLARTFKIHYKWCIERSTQLQDLHFGKSAEFGFAFFPEQIADQRFAEAHMAAVNQVILPYMCHLARLTSSPEIREMCFTAARVAQAHQDHAEIASLDIVPVGLSASKFATVPSRALDKTALEQQVRPSPDGPGLLEYNLNLESPEADISGILSVLAMYGIDGCSLT